MSEFDLIRRLTAGARTRRDDVVIGPGDDAAVMRVPPGHELVLTTDALVSGRHFPADTPPADIGWKSLAVNLSDLAAMGAEPAWITVALVLPDRDPDWLTGFMAGFAPLLEASGAALVGGDLTRGPLTVSIQAAGLVPAGRALRRDGARPGDRIAVTGTPGDAALGLADWLAARIPVDEHDRYVRERLTRPAPRLAAGRWLRDRASAAVDVSDGLAADLTHLLSASGVGGWIDPAALPASAALRHRLAGADREPAQLGGGDDYELCVCLPEAIANAAVADCPDGLALIGRVEAEPGLRLVGSDGAAITWQGAGYDHFPTGG
ncbi:thiamine-phosphate kinase [Spectribacter hydrogenoxidans]|uniref:Thiamine-monophosphate kinase n=1 Tax=Spectribacter hydrogenoxidans TaxID=3075608 RepID=A0ABU3C0P5_9GAMM|nr:thiamine-phosphate kinase [Salinisphaera sp. W335]MDT0635125.1 thiamine-phosphate kinase [Salinisphaera sp. W335]